MGLYVYKVTPTVTVCEPSFQNRTSLTLGEVCGEFGNTGFCNSTHSACMPSTSDTTWRCRCIMGYFRDLRQGECVTAPVKLFNEGKVTCNIETGTSQDVEVCRANLTKDLSSYTIEILSSILRPQHSNFELKADGNQQNFKISLKATITEASTHNFVLYTTVQVGDSIGSVNVSDVIEFEIKSTQSKNLVRKYFTHITDDTLENQVVYRIPLENFQNPTSLTITGSNLFRLDSNSGIVYTRKFVGGEILNDEIGKEIVLTLTDTNVPGTVGYLYIIIIRSEYSIELKEGRDANKNIGTFSVTSSNISISADGIDSGKFYTSSPNLFRGNFDFDFDANQREYRFTVKVDAPSYVTSSFNGQLISNIVVKITDENDLAPRFTKPTYEIQLLLSALSDVLIGFVTADDKDTVGTLSYQIEAKYQNYFKINNAGAITTTVPVVTLSNITGFDREAESVRINVIATDGKQSTTSTVLIHITSPPEENLGLTFKGEIEEGAAIGKNITSVYVKDYTNFRFAQVVEGEKYFRLNFTSGEVWSNKEFDREAENQTKIVVTATKEDALSCSLSVLGELVVTVLDINDNAPKFDPTKYQGTVMENRTGELVSMTVKIKAKDEDSGENAKVRYLLQDNYNAFTIIELNGYAEIRTLIELDRETTSQYNITIIATDGEMNGTAEVVVSVLDVNDNSPSFNSTQVNLSVKEDAGIDTPVGNVKATDPDDGKNAKIIFDIIGGRGYFQIHRDTGVIVVKHALDRETDSSFNFKILARDDGDSPKSSTVDVTITITDINDNAPVFNEDSLQTNKNEDINCAASLHTVVADDKDAGVNKEIEFKILSEMDKFLIDKTTGVISCKPGFEVDYETTTRHEISVEAKDKGDQPKSTVATVVIEINDVNDNDPEFTGDFADGTNDISLNSVTFEGTDPKPLLVIPVEDKDSGINGDISLIISGNFSKFVTIDDNTKLLQAKGSAKPASDDYFLRIIARDGGTPSRETSASLNVRITSTQAISNKITFTQEDIKLDVTEGDASLTFTDNHVKDFVSNKDGKQLKYSIVTPQAIFSMNENNGQITVTQKLDREQKSEHFFVVKAENRQRPEDSDLGLIKVIVRDINDNPPVFKRKKYIFVATEDKAIDYIISSNIEATDADDPANTNLQYRIKSTYDCANYFRINEKTASISIQNRLDYEKWSLCQFNIEVTDSNTAPINTATVEVDVNVLDVNDNPPVFDRTTEAYQLEIREDAKINDQIESTASVTDADDRGNGDIVFKMAPNADDCLFTVEKALEGDISKPILKVKTELDFETKKTSTCIVIAEDQPDNVQDTRSASATFSISIIDVNDNAPELQQQPGTINIERDIEPDTEILARINATDKDSSINAQLKYTLDEVSLLEYFRMNENTGSISIKNSLAALQKDIVVLRVKIEDSGSPVLSTYTTVTINIADANFRPYFKSSTATVNLEEEHEIDDNIYTAVAYDIHDAKDEVCNCTYRLESGQEFFAIDSETGVVRMVRNKVLDREKYPEITVVIKARDKDTISPKDTDNLLLKVNVIDINDQSPVFVQDFSFSINQVSPVGTRIGKVEAIDKDEGRFAITHYLVENVTLPNQQPSNYSRNLIRIDRLSGELFLNDVIEVNATNDFVILVKIKATDSLDDNKIGYTDVRVYVTFDDPNKHTPTCSNNRTTLNVATQKANSTLLQINGTDKDSDINGEISYTLIHGNYRDAFNVDENTGEVTLKYAFNKGFKTDTFPNNVQLIIQVTDKGIVQRTGTCTISINVTGQLEPCIEQSQLNSAERDKEVFRNSMIGMAVALTIFIILFLYSVYRICTSQRSLNGSDNTNPTLPYKPTFPEFNQKQFSTDFDPSRYIGDNISVGNLSELQGYEEPSVGSPRTSAYTRSMRHEEPTPDYDGDDTSEEVDWEQLRRKDKLRSFKRSESSRKDRHKEIYGESNQPHGSHTRDFLRNKPANLMHRRYDDRFAFSNSEWDINNRFSHM